MIFIPRRQGRASYTSRGIRRILLSSHLLVFSLIVLLQPLAIGLHAHAQYTRNFELVGYTFLSSTKGPVYPGSKNAELTISVEYYELKPAENIHGCISLPEGFTTSKNCVSASDENGNVNETAKFGSIRYFYYTIDVDRNVTPGYYKAVLTVKYTLGNESIKETFQLNLHVSPYPRPAIRVERARITPFSYPGSLGVSIEIRLVNDGDSDLVSGYMDVKLPSGFEPTDASLSLPALSSNGGRNSVVINNVFIKPSVKPGSYMVNATLHMTMRTSDGVTYNASQALSFNVTIEEPTEPLLELVDYGWRSGKVYPGTRSSEFYVRLLNLDDMTIAGIDAWLLMPKGFTSPNGSNVIYVSEQGLNLNYGESIQLLFNDIDISPDLVPGEYVAKLVVRLHVVKEGADSILWSNKTLGLYISRPKLELLLLDSGWRQSAVLSGGAVEAVLYTTFQYLGKGMLKSITAKISLENASFRDGLKTSVSTINNLEATYGSIFTITFPDIVVENNTSTIEAIIEVNATIALEGAGYKIISRLFHITARTISEKPYLVAEAHVEYNNRPAPILPTARNLILRITLVNTMPTTVSSAKIDLNTPSWMKVESIGGSCISGIPPGSTCQLAITFNVSADARPGAYLLNMTINYYYSENGMISHGVQSLPVRIVVNDPRDYMATPRLIAYYWGNPGNPVPRVYAGSAEETLTLIIYNPSRWDIDSIAVSLGNVSKIKVLDEAKTCGLPALSTCTLSFHLSLEDIKGGEYSLPVNASYTQQIFGAHIVWHHSWVLHVRISAFEDEGIRLVSAGWENDHEVFPGSEGAVLTVTLANIAPWTLQGAELELHLPNGVKPHGVIEPRAHINGPIASLASFSASFSLDLDKALKPGIYNLSLIVKYWYISGGVLIKRVKTLEIPIKVSSLQDLFKLLRVTWAGEAPKPGDRGVRYIIAYEVIRPEEVNTPILYLTLPKGFTDSYTGLRNVALAPGYNIEALYQVSGSTNLPRSIAELIAELIASTSQQATGQQASIAYYTLVVNIANNIRPGVYNASGYIEFKDYWGSIHRVPVNIPFYVPGGAKLIRVWAPTEASLVNATARIKLYIENNGSAPIYNVYVLLAPQTPNAYPTTTVKYFSLIKPGEVKRTEFSVIFNPSSPWGGGPSYTFAGMVGIIYQDYAGLLHRFNTTISVFLRPPVSLVLSSAKVEYRNGVLKVSISIANLGSLQAKRTVAKIVAMGIEKWSLVGDIDPGSEIPIRMEITGLRKPPEKVKVIITAYDEYNNIYEFRKEVPVKVIMTPTTTTPNQSRQLLPLSQQDVLVIGMTAIFLGASGLLIYRLVKRHQERLGLGGELEGEA